MREGLVGGGRQDFGLRGESRTNRSGGRERSHGGRSERKGFVKRMLQPVSPMIEMPPVSREMGANSFWTEHVVSNDCQHAYGGGIGRS